MKGLPSEFISEVKGRASILEVVSEVVALKRAGKDYKGLCPFHPEKTPSFYVSPDKGFYKCFGCGEGGGVFTFLQKVKGLDFPEAVKELARRYGIAVVENFEDREQYDKRTHILLLYQQAAEYYARLLQDVNEGFIPRQYLKQRGVREETIERFKLGYAPNAWDSLLRYLAGTNHVSPALLEEAGLVRRRAEGSGHYDLFRHRLIVPICDDQGRVIAFGGRTLGDDQVKYLNSPETPIYQKGQHLFAMHLAREAIRSRDSVIVVEGYFDAIALHEHGFENSVAALGTAITERQARSLVKYSDSRRVYLAFDADAAGLKATERGVQTLNQIAEGIGIDLRILTVPGGKDPDECLRSGDAGVEAFTRALAEAPVLIDYQLEQSISQINTNTYSGRIEASKRIVPIIAEIKNAVARGEYVRQWASRLNVREEELLSDVGQYRRMKGPGLSPLHKPKASSRVAARGGWLEAERQMLALYMSGPDEWRHARAALQGETLIDPAHQRIKEALEALEGDADDAHEIQRQALDALAVDLDASRNLVDIILKVEELHKQNAPIEVILREGRARVLQEKIIREKDRLRALLTTAASDDEQAQLSSKIVQLRQLETSLLPGAGGQSQFDDLKARIDGILMET